MYRLNVLGRPAGYGLGAFVVAQLLALGTAHGAGPAAPPAPPLVAPDPADVSTAVLPAGAHRELVVRTCEVCHPIDTVVQKPRTADQWDQLIARMVDHGARASEDEQELIFEYLVRYFGLPDAAATVSPPR